MAIKANYNLAVVGATGNVGREILNILAQRKFPINNIFALASERSAGMEITFNNKTVIVESLNSFDFSKVDIVLSSPGSKVSAEFAPRAAQHCVVIDNTSHFRMDPDIPLIVPEVNGSDLIKYKKRNIIANPNCAVAQLVIALKPLHDYAKIKRVVLTTFQSVSGAGKNAMDELDRQTTAKLNHTIIKPHVFYKPIAFNVIPQIGDFNENGDTGEEVKIVEELKKILDPSIEASATSVRVPVFVGHSESVNIEFEHKISAQEARKILNQVPGAKLIDDPANFSYTTPIECVGKDEVFISRIRADKSRPNALNMWVVSDNLRKGAALNAVQIAEELVKNYI